MSLVIDAMSQVATFTSIQGNISAGKSTCFNALQKYIKDNNLDALTAPLSSSVKRDLFLLLEEPVVDWSTKNCSLLNCNGEGDDSEVYSALDLFYKGMDKEKYKTNPWALDFQTLTFTTRLENTCEQLGKIPIFEDTNTSVHVISERSLRTDHLFFKNVYESGRIPKYQWDIYERFHDIICRATLKKEDYMVYIKTSPEKCYDRLHNKRKREAEVKNGIPLEYLQSLHLQHEQMIREFSLGADRVIEVDFEKDLTEEEIAAFAANLMEKLRSAH